MSIRWAIEIQNTSLDLRNLTDLLDGLGFTLIDRFGSPAFTSTDINTCDTAAIVFEKAKDLRTAFTGPAQVDPSFKLGAVIDFSCNPPKRTLFMEVESAVVKCSVDDTILTVSPPKGLSKKELEKWKCEKIEQEYQNRLKEQRAKLEPVFFNPRAAKIIELLSENSLSGEKLYKAYELAEGHPNNRKFFQAQFCISREEFNRFKDVVHNPKVSGDWARHAYEDEPKSNNPMTKKEAENFVRRIAVKWLETVQKHKN